MPSTPSSRFRLDCTYSNVSKYVDYIILLSPYSTRQARRGLADTVSTRPMLTHQQAIYIWVGVAALVGSIAGVVLFLVFKFIASALKIDGTTITPAKAPCRTVQDFRATRRMKKEPHSGSPSGPRIDKVAAMRRRGLSSHPILEDEFEF